mmetsp:Transcript_58792/g.149203  ORF Transcript_58792/g.149203 Transcript_58792/m.149203 type:complete len:149 (-) Transcript_58792:140-586(-)
MAPIKARRRQHANPLLLAAAAALAATALSSLAAAFAGQLPRSARSPRVGRQAIELSDQWSVMGKKAQELEQLLDTLVFNGTAADGGVVVEVNGRQKPVGLKLADSLDIDGDVGKHIQEAYAQAEAQSLEEMTHMLQELYATHFKDQPV